MLDFVIICPLWKMAMVTGGYPPYPHL